jgi:hypothetical protein
MGWQDDSVAVADTNQMVAASRSAVPVWQRQSAPVADPDMPSVRSFIKGNLAPKAAAPQSVTGFMDALEAGLQVSVSGLLARGEAPSKTLSPDAPITSRIGSGAASIVGDIPFMVGGALLGGAAGIETGPGAAITGMAGAFALPAGLRATLMDAYTKGDINTFGEFWNRASGVIWETAKGWMTGATTGGAGYAARAALPAVASAAVKATVPTAAELGTMVTVGSALEGHAPRAQDFVDAAILLGAGKGAGSVAGRLRQVYSATGKKPADVAIEADPITAMELRAPAQEAAKEPVVTVYHGSPHDFTKFDAQKIGTGEGAQAFGHGLYFAESADVARSFAEVLGGRGGVYDMNPNSPTLGQFVRPSDGHLYRVEIPTSTIDRMLDWDKPLSEQPESVKAALRASGLVDRAKAVTGRDDPTGSDLHWAARREVAPDAQQAMAGVGLAEAADRLRALGIPGIRYLDGGSRTTGEGTRNFVLFDDSLSRIVEKNGKPIAADELPEAFKGAARAETARQIVPGVNAEAVAAKPFADALPQVAGEPAKPTHVNYNLINTVEDTKLAMARVSEVYERQIQEQRRGTVSWDQTSAEAGKILADTLGGVDMKLIMPREPGTPAGAAEILARKQLTVGAAEDMMRARDELLAKGAQATLEDRLQFTASIERLAMIQSEFLGARSEAGRALNILKSTAIEAARAKQIQDVITMYGKDPMALAEMMRQIDNPAGAAKFAREAVKATTWEKIVEAWKAGLLSGPVTHVANIMGNTTFMVLRAPIEALAAGFGALRGGADRVQAAEPLARVVGALQGSLDGLKLAGHVLRTGEQPGKSEQYRQAISGLKGDVIRLPYRFLSAEDAIFKTMNERGEAYSLATRQATIEGLNPLTREFSERVVQLVQDPPAKMAEAITEAGARFTFNTELGEKGRAVQNFVRTWHLEWAIPFIRTPANIAKELGRMTPAAPLVKEWREAMAKPGAERDKALAEIAVGTGIMTSVFIFALDGSITGAGEPDAGKRRVQQAGGWQPYSIKVGDTYYSYQRLQPVGTLMGLAADIAEVWDHLTEEEADKIPKMLTVAFGNAVTNQTFLQGITNIVNALSDPKRFGPRLAQQFAASVVPNIVGQTTAMNDPLTREVDSMVDAIKARIPGARETLLPKRDVFGEPVHTKERLGGLSPIVESKESADPVRAEAARLNISAGDTPKKVHVGRGSGKLGDVKLTPEQKDVFGDVAGHLAHDVLSQIVSGPGWEGLPDLVKKRAFAKVFLQAHRAGAAAALPPDLRAGIAQEITQKIQRELQPEGEP